MGPPDVRIDGVPVTTDTRKAIALLAYLSQRETPPGRDHLVDFLWPNSGPERGRGALRRTISTLRTSLGGRWVVADRERVSLDRRDFWVDTDDLSAGWGDALALVRGRFLEGFWLRDAPDFDDWQMATAEHYDRRFRQLLVEGVEDALARNDPRAAIDHGERLVALDPIDEIGHRALMSAHAVNGDRAAATRQFRKCVAILELELGVEPLPETVSLHEEILAGSRARVVTGLPPPATRSPEPSDFVGRDEAAAALLEMASVPGTVAVRGSLGSGRTRLIAEVLPDAIVARAHSGEKELPFSLARSLLEACLNSSGPVSLPEATAAAGHLHPGIAAIAPPPPPLEGDLGPVRLRAGVAAALVALVGDRPIVVDDFDLADPASADTIRYLASRSEDLGIKLILVTDDDHARAVDVGPLGAESIAWLAAGSGIDVDTLVALTGGLPGPILEVLSDPVPGEALGRLRARRIADLDPTDLQVLEGLVVLGPATSGLLSAVTGRATEDVVRSLDGLVKLGIVEGGGSGSVAAWAADVVAESTGAARLALLHGRAADALAHAGDLEAKAARAWHLHRAGRREESAVAHAEAGAKAAAVHAHDTARAHFHAALAAGHADAGAIHRKLGDVERAAGHYSAAVASYHAAAAYGTDTDLERSIGDVYRRWGRWALADASLAAAESLASPHELPLVLADRAEIAFRSGDRESASDLIRRSIALLDEEPSTVARVRNVAGLVLDDREQFEVAVAVARKGGLMEEEAAALNNLALACLKRHQPEVALDHATRSLALLTHGGDRHRRAAVHGNLADVHHALGDEATSREHLLIAVGLFAEVGIEPGQWEPEVWKLTSW